MSYNELLSRSAKEWNLASLILFAELEIITPQKLPRVISTFKKLSNTFQASGRLDAEYYQPKYDYLFNELKRFKTKRIKQIAMITKSMEPGSNFYRESGVPFIRVADFSKFGFSEPSIYLDNEVFKQVIRPQKDTILLSKDGSVGIAYKVSEPLDIITSGAIVHLNITDREILPDYLTLVINSIVVQFQAERDAGGSVIQHWKTSEIGDVIIPILPMSIQEELSLILQKSFSLREESKNLLFEATRIVESAIGNRN